MNKLLSVIVILCVFGATASAQMPPPGYERAKKIQEERNKMPIMERDSITLTDTILIFDPNTYEEETKIVTSTMSLKDYCIRYFAMSNPEILLDHQPHIIIDPQTFEDITIRLTPDGKIERVPNKRE
ncbi:MAG TPA: hypothetical protein VMZ69_11660 [Saprospiraceae bacterium]|nr:hypothetical protein [Saprospiraceae bacterium]